MVWLAWGLSAFARPFVTIQIGGQEDGERPSLCLSDGQRLFGDALVENEDLQVLTVHGLSARVPSDTASGVACPPRELRLEARKAHLLRRVRLTDGQELFGTVSRSPDEIRIRILDDRPLQLDPGLVVRTRPLLRQNRVEPILWGAAGTVVAGGMIALLVYGVSQATSTMRF